MVFVLILLFIAYKKLEFRTLNLWQFLQSFFNISDINDTSYIKVTMYMTYQSL